MMVRIDGGYPPTDKFKFVTHINAGKLQRRLVKFLCKRMKYSVVKSEPRFALGIDKRTILVLREPEELTYIQLGIFKTRVLHNEESYVIGTMFEEKYFLFGEEIPKDDFDSYKVEMLIDKVMK